MSNTKNANRKRNKARLRSETNRSSENMTLVEDNKSSEEVATGGSSVVGTMEGVLNEGVIKKGQIKCGGEGNNQQDIKVNDEVTKEDDEVGGETKT